MVIYIRNELHLYIFKKKQNKKKNQQKTATGKLCTKCTNHNRDVKHEEVGEIASLRKHQGVLRTRCARKTTMAIRSLKK